MGASTSVYGIRKPDDQWHKFKSIIDSLELAGMSWEDAPKEVQEFFGHERPDDKGIIVPLGSQYGNNNHECCQEHKEEMEDGYVIEISKLPKNITHIKVITSY